jgi:hypothetical protein
MPLSPEQKTLCERLEKGESTATAATLIRQRAHEIDDLWDRLSRAYALVRKHAESRRFERTLDLPLPCAVTLGSAPSPLDAASRLPIAYASLNAGWPTRPQPISTFSSRARKDCGSRSRLCTYAQRSVVVSSIS